MIPADREAYFLTRCREQNITILPDAEHLQAEDDVCDGPAFFRAAIVGGCIGAGLWIVIIAAAWDWL